MSVKDGFFAETEAMWPGQKFCLQVEQVLYHERSEFQDILIFQSTDYGKVLVLDGVIQMTERDEFAYQEMLAHIPMFCHANPKKILIVGGGDGGILREVARHPEVEKIDMCEIDPKVCEVCRQFKFSTATAFDDPRTNLVHMDAAEYVADLEENEKYDCIIVDSSDPVGPAASLFQPIFYENMKKALAPGGIIATQGECMWLHLDFIVTILGACSNIFECVDYAFTTIPSYPSGQIGFVLASNAPNDLSVPLREPSAEMQESLRYYNNMVHMAAFVLPQFAEKKISKRRQRAAKEDCD